jgi:beta-galactosidase
VHIRAGKIQKELNNWLVYNFPVDYDFQKNVKYIKAAVSGPAWYKGSFRVGKPGDTFLDMSTWGKGMVWVNGHNLGRYWKIGPQQTLYLPGVWLKEGDNEIIILDVDQPAIRKVAGVSTPILDKINPDASLLHRKKGQKLQLKMDAPVHMGSFPAGNGWKEVNFSKSHEGRYLCLEALNAQHEGDAMASIAEMELIGKEGKVLSTLKWKVLYASSEEITSGNHAADKIFDLQESTYWQTQSVGAKPSYPHQVVIDLGSLEVITGIRYLPHTDKKTYGTIKEYRVFIKKEPFLF